MLLTLKGNNKKICKNKHSNCPTTTQGSIECKSTICVYDKASVNQVFSGERQTVKSNSHKTQALIQHLPAPDCSRPNPFD